ncbi:hypothetical protein [Acetobacterium sp.]|uniref:hypothetical protein n=1 Tax=Acetobacterium sp. TaxID=1872094 RepID=UPI002F3E421F
MKQFLFINISVLLILSLVFKTTSIVAVGLIGVFLVVSLVPKGNDKLFYCLSLIFIISVILILTAYYGYMYQFGIPYFGGGSDDLAFEHYSKYVIANHYMMPEQIILDPQFTYSNSIGFIWILSWVMRLSNVFGEYHTIAFRVLNIYFLLALSILVFRYFERKYQFTSKQNLIVLYVIALFPNSQYISIHVFRDTLISLILFSVLFVWDNYFDAKSKGGFSLIKAIALTLILGYISYWLRNESMVFLIAIILTCVVLKDNILSKKNSILFIFLVFLAFILINYYNIWDLILVFNEKYFIHKMELSDGLSNIVFSMSLFPFGILARLGYGLISPIPITILKIGGIFENVTVFFQVIIGFGVIGQIYMLPYLFKNIKRVDKIFISFATTLVGIVITTFTFRHFIMLYPFMVILMFREFFETEKGQRINYFVGVTGVLIFVAGFYLLIK